MLTSKPNYVQHGVIIHVLAWDAHAQTHATLKNTQTIISKQTVT